MKGSLCGGVGHDISALSRYSSLNMAPTISHSVFGSASKTKQHKGSRIGESVDDPFDVLRSSYLGNTLLAEEARIGSAYGLIIERGLVLGSRRTCGLMCSMVRH